MAGLPFSLWVVFEEDGHGAFALAGNAGGGQFLDDTFEAGIIKTLAVGVVELYAEAAVNGVELDLGEGDHLAPDGEVFGVAGLQLHQFLAGLFEHGGIILAGGVDQAIEPLHFGDGIGFQGARFEWFFQPTSNLPNCVPQSPI